MEGRIRIWAQRAGRASGAVQLLVRVHCAWARCVEDCQMEAFFSFLPRFSARTCSARGPESDGGRASFSSCSVPPLELSEIGQRGATWLRGGAEPGSHMQHDPNIHTQYGRVECLRQNSEAAGKSGAVVSLCYCRRGKGAGWIGEPRVHVWSSVRNSNARVERSAHSAILRTAPLCGPSREPMLQSSPCCSPC